MQLCKAHVEAKIRHYTGYNNNLQPTHTHGSRATVNIDINPVVCCHYFPRGGGPPSTVYFLQQRTLPVFGRYHIILLSTTLYCLVAEKCVNNLSKVVTWQWNGQKQNSRPLDCMSDALVPPSCLKMWNTLVHSLQPVIIRVRPHPNALQSHR